MQEVSVVVREFVHKHEAEYLKLLAIVLQACEQVKTELGSGVVVRVYTRGSKQGGRELKTEAKLALACESPVKSATLKKIGDVIGVTVVVQYPDETDQVLDRVKDILAGKSIEEERRRRHKETYYASHSTFLSKAVSHGGLRCEVQCKTVLHDAWSTKMHDLTYKPQGALDDRIRKLVEAISTSLEGLEQQSQIVRNIVNSRLKVEGRPFRSSLKSFLSGMYKSLGPDWEKSGALKRLGPLDREISSKIDLLTTLAQDDKQVSELAHLIRDAFANEPDIPIAWVMATRFAGARMDPDAAFFLSELGEQYLAALPDLARNQQISEHEIRSLPMGFYAVQDFEHALEYVDRVLEQAPALSLTEECIALLKFNKATWLLERESVRPSKPSHRPAIEQESAQLLEASRPIIGERDRMSLLDTDGLKLIVFATTKEDVRRGIDMCNEAGTSDDPDEAEVAAAYAEWRTHVGWRRYFEVAEVEDGGSPT